MRRCLSILPRYLLAFAAVVVLGGGECGTDVGDKSVGDACTRDSECMDGLICLGGECAEPRDGSVDGG